MAQSVIEVYKVMTSGADGGYVDGGVHLKHSGVGITLCGIGVPSVCVFSWDGDNSSIWHPMSDADVDLTFCERCLIAQSGRSYRVISRPKQSCRLGDTAIAASANTDMPNILMGAVISQALLNAGYIVVPVAVLQDVRARVDAVIAASNQDMAGTAYMLRSFVETMQTEMRGAIEPISPYLPYSQDGSSVPAPIPPPPLPVTVAQGAHDRLVQTIKYLATLIERSPRKLPNETEYRIVLDGITEAGAQIQRVATPLRQYVEAHTAPKNPETAL